MNLKGSETERNLYKTFAGESRANTKYSLYAEQARKEGYRWVAEIFEETAGNEKAHAREVLKKYLCKIIQKLTLGMLQKVKHKKQIELIKILKM